MKTEFKDGDGDEVSLNSTSKLTVDAAIAVSGLGGAAVTDHDRDPLCGGHLNSIIEG